MTKRLFDEYPELENEHVILRKMRPEDAPALQVFRDNEKVYRFLPTFLYEQKYEDASDVIAGMDEECFRTKGSILLAVCLKEEPSQMVGIAEIYNYEEKKAKASIGVRLDSSVWGRGIASQVISLLKEYLIVKTGLKTITAHILQDNAASAGAVRKCGFLKKYPNIYSDWGFEELSLMDKYVFKRDWLDHPEITGLAPVRVEQFVMAYEIEQDRIRALLPDGFGSLRPVLRINTEIRDESVVYAEFNTPVQAEGRRGWLNIANWKNTNGDEIGFERNDAVVTIRSPFLEIKYQGVGISGGCPAERDNEGCYYIGSDKEFRPAEKIAEKKEFCDCEFRWRFHEGDAGGVSTGKTLPAQGQPLRKKYAAAPLTAENAAAIPCRQVLGSYIVRFERYRNE